ncbi:MAG: hypothetical protein QOF39_2662 [Frankiales bacterium]|nr:hypothetical protein [Frankiales bacterium]
MNRRTESLLLAAMGCAALILAVGGDALVFIRPGLVPYHFASGVVLLLLAVAPAVSRRSPDEELAAEEHAEHEHHHSRRAPWLVMAPLLVLLVVAPGPLGASAASTAQRAVQAPSTSSYPPVGAEVAGAVPMTLAEYTSRAIDDAGHSLTGVPVRLTGFVAKAKDGNGFLLSRFTIFCCAADAEIEQIRILGSTSVLPDNTWVTVTGTWPAASAPGAAIPELTATSVVQVKRPHAPYEYTLQYAD